jgi:anhydro-N-acetylmuramic acid kinase
VNEKSERRLAIGLMSGTSMDGIDAALVEISEEPFAVRTLSKLCLPYSKDARAELGGIADGRASIDDLCRADAALGHLFADAVEALPLHGLKFEEIEVIGCHGQTVRHLPHPAASLGREVSTTLQIGDPAVLAERTGVTVVSDFRARDIAAGGQGAPLIPLFDYLLLADAKVGRVALNIGGMANVTFLPPGIEAEAVIAFDTGPGNALMDLLAFEISGGELDSDRDGRIASEGRVLESLLDSLLDHAYLKREPPKSTGREEFGGELLLSLRAKGYGGADLMATLAAFTAHSIALAVERFWPASDPPGELIVSGGGSHNATLMQMIAGRMMGTRIRSIGEFGVDPDFKEAVAFAVLADRTIHGLHGNLPSATGARQPVILGNITPGQWKKGSGLRF